jgi:isoquinoline 1-oxidoreductase subunit beta
MFVVEGVINELAEKAKVDPVDYRRELMAENPRARHVLDLAAEKSAWGTPLPPRTGRGIALQHAFGSYLACVIEASVTNDGDIKLRHVVVALDCGQAINPRNVVAQVEGAVLFGLSAALWGEINVDKRQIVQKNFNSYRVLRIDETPPIETHLVSSTEPPEGVGEAGTSIVFPALVAAVFAATGKRLRSLPFNRHAADLASNNSVWRSGLGASLSVIAGKGIVLAKLIQRWRGGLHYNRIVDQAGQGASRPDSGARH